MKKPTAHVCIRTYTSSMNLARAHGGLTPSSTIMPCVHVCDESGGDTARCVRHRGMSEVGRNVCPTRNDNSALEWVSRYSVGGAIAANRSKRALDGDTVSRLSDANLVRCTATNRFAARRSARNSSETQCVTVLRLFNRSE